MELGLAAKLIYVASTLANYRRVMAIQDRLRAAGAFISFDWASVYHRHGKMVSVDVAQSEVDGVLSADILLLVLPGARGSHFEYGVAVGAGIQTVILCENPDDEISFHRLPCSVLCRSEDEAFSAISRCKRRALSPLYRKADL